MIEMIIDYIGNIGGSPFAQFKLKLKCRNSGYYTKAVSMYGKKKKTVKNKWKNSKITTKK